MPHPILSHIIGTTMLVVLSIVVVASITMIALTVQYDITKARLQEAAENIASTVIEVISLVNSSSRTQYIVKELTLPKDFEEKGYTVRIGNDPSGWHIEVYLSTLTWVSAKAPLNWASESINVNTGEGETPLKIDQRTVYATNELRSGYGRPVVWCVKGLDGVLKVGLGFER